MKTSMIGINSARLQNVTRYCFSILCNDSRASTFLHCWSVMPISPRKESLKTRLSKLEMLYLPMRKMFAEVFPDVLRN